MAHKEILTIERDITCRKCGSHNVVMYGMYKLVNKIKTISTQMKEILKPKSDIMALSDKQIDIIIQCFDDPAYTTSARDIISSLRNKGLDYPEKVIRDALLENLLYVEAIELTKDDWQNMLLALDEWGESLWYKWSNSS